MNRLHRLVLFAALVSPIPLLGDVGVLIPTGSQGPSPAILSLDEMTVDIRIDNGDARVSVRQVFGSHRPGVLEGEYVFSLPTRATVSAFAVWDGVVRIPGVILERRRAEEIYENLRQQQIDPGLLQQGERGTEGAAEAARTSAFSARITPIPGYGTKRLEMEYHEAVPVENLKSAFSLPLRPDVYNAQSAGLLTLSFRLTSAHAIREFRVGSRAYPLQMGEQTPQAVSGTFTGRNVAFSEDFSVEYSLDPAKADTLEVLTYRSPEPGPQSPADRAPRPRGVESGFFQASALLAAANQADSATAAAPLAHGHRTVRHVAVDAVGQARAQLSSPRRAASIARAGGSVQSALVQHRDFFVCAGPGGRRDERGREGPGIRAGGPASRRDEPAARARNGG